MEKTGKLVLCVCLTFMLMGSSEGQNVTECPSCTNETHATNNNTEETGATKPTATTPMPGHNSTKVTSDNHNNSTSTTRPHHSSSTSTVSTNSTYVTTSSSQPTVSSGAPQSPGATNSTTHLSPNGTVGSNVFTVAPKPLKGGSASLFRLCSQLLVPVISILICSA